MTRLLPHVARAFVAVALYAAFSTGAARAADAKTEALLAKLDGASQSTKTLAAEFTQKNKVKLFKQEVRSSGRLFFERPRRIRWEYLQPDPSVLVLDGDSATLRTPGAAPQVFDLAKDATMRAVFDQLLLWLGSGSVKQAEGDYAIAATGTADAPALQLTPRPGSQAARAMKQVELRFDKQLVLRGITLHEASGDEKDIAFTKVERNGKLPADAFK